MFRKAYIRDQNRLEAETEMNLGRDQKRRKEHPEASAHFGHARDSYMMAGDKESAEIARQKQVIENNYYFKASSGKDSNSGSSSSSSSYSTSSSSLYAQQPSSSSSRSGSSRDACGDAYDGVVRSCERSCRRSC